MSLRVWLPLNGDLHNQGLSDELNFTITGTITDAAGKIGMSKEFASSNAIAPFNFALGDEATVCCWAYYNSRPTTSSNDWLVHLGSTSGYENAVLGLSTYHKTLFCVMVGGKYDSTYTHNFELNTWYHICLVWKKPMAYLYINGNLANTYDNLNGGTKLTSNKISIASNVVNSSTKFKGRLNDVRLYDHALSTKEVKEIAKGLVLHYLLNHNGLGNKNLLANDWNLTAWSKESGISVSWDDTVGMYKVLDSSHTSSRWGIYQDITLTANTTYTFSVDGMKKDQNVNFGFAQGTSWPANDGSFTTTISRLSKTITVGSANANYRIYLNINPVSNGSNYGYFRAPKLEIGSVATPWCSYTDNTVEYDTSGYCNNGTKTGTFTYSTDTPKYKVSTYINATSSANRIESINDIVLPVEGITTTFWIKTSKTKAQVVFATSQIEYATNTGGSYIWVDPRANAEGFSMSTFNDNEWNFIAIIRQDSTFKMYINGVEVTSKGGSNYWIHNKNTLYLYNRSYNNNYGAEAYLSDFRIYATALSAQDILSLYHNSAFIDEQGNIHGAIH